MPVFKNAKKQDAPSSAGPSSPVKRTTSVAPIVTVPRSVPVLPRVGQQVMGAPSSDPLPVAGYPDPYKLLADARKVYILKEINAHSKVINCVFGFCGITRYRYYVRDAVSGRDLFKAKLAYSSTCNVCAGGTRHNYTLDLACLPLDGSGIAGTEGAFLSTSSSATSQVATGGHGVMDMRNRETVGRVIPAPSGSFTVKEANNAVAFRVAIPINTGFGGSTSEMLVEEGTTTALVGRIVKNWTSGDNKTACCFGSEKPGPFLIDMTAVSNIKKRALLVVAGIVADGIAFGFRAAPAVEPSAKPPKEPGSPASKKPLLQSP